MSNYKRKAPVDFLTVGQMCEYAKVAPRTIGKWCDVGLLPHTRLPGTNGKEQNHRRVKKAAFVEFLKSRGWDVPKELRPGVRLAHGLPSEEVPGGWTWCRSAYSFGAACATDEVDTVVVGDEYGLAVAAEAAAFALRHSSGATVVLVVGEDVTPERAASVWSGWVERRPLDVPKLLNNLETQ